MVEGPLRGQESKAGMNERPIIFSPAMIAAIQAGTKTQTRRILKPQPLAVGPNGGTLRRVAWNERMRSWDAQYDGDNPILIGPPKFGVVGDRLWVREGLRRPNCAPWVYAADNQAVMVDREDETAMLVWAHHKEQDYCPSIHMPRWASRITLEITAPERIERVQDISEADALAEGIWGQPYPAEAGLWYGMSAGAIYYWGQGASKGGGFDTAVQCFRCLWDSIHGTGAWERNDWVRVVTFRRVV